jgi:hypothetical protein
MIDAGIIPLKEHFSALDDLKAISIKMSSHCLTMPTARIFAASSMTFMKHKSQDMDGKKIGAIG